MTSGAPIEMFWDSERNVLVPVNTAWARRAAKQWPAGEVFHIIHQEPRSMASHGHYFAVVTEAWRNLPEALASRFPTDEHLRKYALIRTGWHNSQAVACETRSAALKVAALARSLDEFCAVELPRNGTVVTILTARTQSFRMGKEDFQKSKDDVLGFLADMIGVSQARLATNAGRAA